MNAVGAVYGGVRRPNSLQVFIKPVLFDNKQ